MLAVVEGATSPLSRWESFYVIVGSSGAALTGLQFVVITLIADSSRQRSMAQIRAFGTPTIVHFCAVLLLSAIQSAPWQALSGAGLAVGVCGAAGIAYAAIVVRLARSQKGYVPVLEDWVWHAVLPVIAYAAIVIGGVVLSRHPGPALFLIAAAAVLLLFIGIHNAWDTVTYIVIEQPSDGTKT
jgi:hypothetical protein